MGLVHACWTLPLSPIPSQKCPLELDSYHQYKGDQGKVTHQNVLRIACEFGDKLCGFKVVPDNRGGLRRMEGGE